MIDLNLQINQQSKREFDRTLAEYMKVTKRTLGEVINTKLNFIGRNAVLLTYHSTKPKIEREMGKIVTVTYTNKRGKVKTKRRVAHTASSKRNDAPRAALIINRRLGRKGEKGLYGNKMSAAVLKLLGARNRSLNFVRASWRFGVNILDKVVKSKAGAPRIEGGVKTVGQPKGGATPAHQEGNQVTGTIWSNLVIDKNSAFVNRIVTTGLTKAFNKEMQSMKEYIARKLQDTKLFK